jgi:hypothetical protein
MKSRAIHQCQCDDCVAENAVTQQQHGQFNLLMSRLDEQQRRWMAALEAKKMGHGGIRQLHRMTGLDINTIRRGIEELESDLANRPTDRTRVPGGGRKALEKKMMS